MQQTAAGKATAEVLDLLAAKFGTTAEHLWGVLIRQQYIYGVTATLLAVAFGIGGWALFRWCRDVLRDDDRSAYADDAPLIIGMVVGCLAGLIAVGFTYDAVTMFVNPEYGAIKDVLNAMKAD